MKVFSKEIGKMQDIKKDRFNPEIHIVVEDVPSDVFDNVHQETVTTAPTDVPVDIGTPTDETIDIPIVGTVGTKKRRGMPKGGWPKKVV